MPKPDITSEITRPASDYEQVIGNIVNALAKEQLSPQEILENLVQNRFWNDMVLIYGKGDKQKGLEEIGKRVAVCLVERMAISQVTNQQMSA